MQSRRRSLVKALSWRLVALLITFGVALVIFDDVQVAVSVGVLDSLIKILVYYLHERAWERVPHRRQRVEASPQGVVANALHQRGDGP